MPPSERRAVPHLRPRGAGMAAPAGEADVPGLAKNGRTKATETTRPPCPAVFGSGLTGLFWQGFDKGPDSFFCRDASPERQTAFSGFSRIAASAINSGCGGQTTRPGRPVCRPTSGGGASREPVPPDVSVSPSTSSFGGLYDHGKRCRTQTVVNSRQERLKWSLRTCASLAPINLRTRFLSQKAFKQGAPAGARAQGQISRGRQM